MLKETAEKIITEARFTPDGDFAVIPSHLVDALAADLGELMSNVPMGKKGRRRRAIMRDIASEGSRVHYDRYLEIIARYGITDPRGGNGFFAGRTPRIRRTGEWIELTDIGRIEAQ